MRLILLFVLLPFLELMILLKLAELTSALTTLGIIIATGVVGVALARRQGLGVIRRLTAELEAGEMPTTSLVDALLIFVAGALLITPGVITDSIGFLLLVPFFRRFVRSALIRGLRARTIVTTHHTGLAFPRRPMDFDQDRVIDSYVVPRDDQPLP